MPGFHADPEILYSNKTKKYYIYSTTDGQPGWGGLVFYCFSSVDLKNWKDEGVMLDLKSDQVPWADGNAWALCIEEKLVGDQYKYFFYYSEILRQEEESRSEWLQVIRLPDRL